MTAQIVGEEMKLIWRLFVSLQSCECSEHHIRAGRRFPWFWVESSKCFPAASSCGGTDLYLNTCGGHNEDSCMSCLQTGNLHFPFVLQSFVILPPKQTVMHPSPLRRNNSIFYQNDTLKDFC